MSDLQLSEGRRPFDFYETPKWQTAALRKRIHITGRVFECCVGDRSIADEFKDCILATNDVDHNRQADFHLDARLAASWSQFLPADWVVTNPPFNAALEILKHAEHHAAVGVVMLLRLSFLEPTEARTEWLSNHPPLQQMVLPRWSYKGNGSTDSVTTAWFVWVRDRARLIDARPIIIVPLKEKPKKGTQDFTARWDAVMNSNQPVVTIEPK